MADIDDDNIEIALKLLDVQKNMTKELEERKRVLGQLSGIDKTLERSIQQQMATTAKQTNEIRKQYAFLYESQLKYFDMEEGAEKDSKRTKLQSHKDQISMLEDQVRLSRERWEFELSKLKEIKAQHDFINSSIQERLFVELKEVKAFGTITEKLQQLFPKMSAMKVGVAGAMLILTGFARELYNSFEKASAEFRKYAGMFRDSAKPMRIMTEGIAIGFAHVGVTIDGAYTSLKTLGVEMGGLHNVTKELVATTSLLSSQLGVSEENTSEMLRNMAFISKSTLQAQKNSAYFTGNLSAAAGIPLNIVMGDIAKMSGTTMAMISKIPSAIIKSAVEARRLNSTLNDMAIASESILDFTSSVEAEMKASVLLGKSINLQAARELAYRGKLVESTREILNIAKRIDFQNLDVFQMQAFAQATGRSVEELSKMLQAEKEMNAARASGDPNIQKQLRAYEEMKAANESSSLNSSKNLETMLMQRANQERMVALQNKWNQMLMQATQIFLPILDLSMSIAGALMSLYTYTFQLLSPMGNLLDKFSKIQVFSLGILSHTRAMSSVMTTILGLGSKFLNVVSYIGKAMGIFGKFLGPIGWIITGFQLISSAVKNFTNPDLTKWEAFKRTIYEVVLKPFKDAWEWIKGIFVGRSPSELALGIVKGLLSVQGMLFDALVVPFKKAWAWISGNPITTNISPTAQNPVETLTSARTSRSPLSEEEEGDSGTSKALNDILVAIKALNANLESGKIGVYMDGSLVSSTLARKLEFKGSFGTNR